MKNTINIKEKINVPVDYLTDSEYQSDTVNRIDEMKLLAKAHILHSIFSFPDELDMSLPCFKCPTDPDFELPSKDTVKITVNAILNKGYSKNDISDFVGISRTGSNRLLNYWINKDSDRKINKSNWILLATLAGLMLPTMVKNK